MSSYSPCRLLSSTSSLEENMEMANSFKYCRDVTTRIKHQSTYIPMRAWRSIKKLAGRFLRRNRRVVVGLVRRVVLARLVRVKRKICRVLKAKSTGNRHVLWSYDGSSYSMNFDDGRWQQEEVEYFTTRSFSFRYGQASSLYLSVLYEESHQSLKSGTS